MLSAPRRNYDTQRPPLPPIASYGRTIVVVVVVVVVVIVVDSHVQRIVLATEETTVTQQVSHRPIKCQSRLWPQRGTKVNGSHHGDNPLLRPTGIQIATNTLQCDVRVLDTEIKGSMPLPGFTSIMVKCFATGPMPQDRQLVLALPTKKYDIDRGALVGVARGI